MVGAPGFAAGFRRIGHGEQVVRCPAQRAVGLCGHGDQRHAETAAIGDQVAQLPGLAGFRQGQDGVLFADHAEIAMARLGGVDVIGGRAGRRHRRGDLARYMAGLADTGADDPPLHVRNTVYRCYESLINRSGQQVQPVALGFNDTASRCGGIELGHWISSGERWADRSVRSHTRTAHVRGRDVRGRSGVPRGP